MNTKSNETAFNGYLANAIRRIAPPGWAVKAEKSGQGKDDTRPDIVIHLPYGLRSIIETEFGAPAIGDAKARLDYQFKDGLTSTIRSVLAVGLPTSMGEIDDGDKVADMLTERGGAETVRFDLQIVTGSAPDADDVIITPPPTNKGVTSRHRTVRMANRHP